MNSGLNISGIYKIESKVHPDRIYIGSAVNIRHRKGGHFLTLKKEIHKNPKLQAHYNKYGADDLTLSVVAVCDKDELIPINGIVRPEQFFIWAYNPWFNVNKIAGSPIGMRPSMETRRKISEAQIGRIPWNKGKKGVMPIPWNKGMKGLYKMSEESNEKKRLAMTGRKRPTYSEEWRNNMRKAKLGRKDSAETRKRKSESAKKKPPVTQETRDKLRIINTGKKRPPITDEERLHHQELKYLTLLIKREEEQKMNIYGT